MIKISPWRKSYVFAKTMVRYIIIMISFPKSGADFLLRWIGYFPLFKYEADRNNDALHKKKTYLRDNKKNVGHAIRKKVIRLRFCGITLLKFPLPEGVELTAEHFFLNRPLDDVKFLLELCKDHISIEKNSLILDPGCGTGKHLMYLTDVFGCSGIGVDVYGPAITVAEQAKLNSRTEFFNHSSLEKGFLEKVIPNGCDYVFINSWLNHVYGYDGYGEFMEQLVSSCHYILCISSLKYELEELFDDPEIIEKRTHEMVGRGGNRIGTCYALIKGKR